MASALCSAAIILRFWDGSLELVDNKGLWGLLVNVAVLIGLLRLWKQVALAPLSERGQGWLEPPQPR
jgi:hypothetical protein